MRSVVTDGAGRRHDRSPACALCVSRLSAVPRGRQSRRGVANEGILPAPLAHRRPSNATLLQSHESSVIRASTMMNARRRIIRTTPAPPCNRRSGEFEQAVSAPDPLYGGNQVERPTWAAQPQVRRPLRPFQESPRTPRARSSERRWPERAEEKARSEAPSRLAVQFGGAQSVKRASRRTVRAAQGGTDCGNQITPRDSPCSLAASIRSPHITAHTTPGRHDGPVSSSSQHSASVSGGFSPADAEDLAPYRGKFRRRLPGSRRSPRTGRTCSVSPGRSSPLRPGPADPVRACAPTGTRRLSRTTRIDGGAPCPPGHSLQRPLRGVPAWAG